jgi:hypothetical protein
VVNSAHNWLQENAKMYRGNNASDCMINAYAAGMSEIIEGLKFDLLPACTKALESVSKCLSDDGERCAPNMDDFVYIANALTIIDDFYQRVNSGA